MSQLSLFEDNFQLSESFNLPSECFLCGLDEAGRGPLAGPVVAGAVILPKDFTHEYLNDSKKISEKKRDILEPIIKENAIAWGIGSASHVEIDEINILEASLLAMKRAYEQMFFMLQNTVGKISTERLFAIVDGTFCPDIPCQTKAEPKADGNYPCVMAASILAKTERDRIMKKYATIYPQYGYEKHKGYPTVAHREICLQIGMSPIQRKTFKF